MGISGLILGDHESVAAMWRRLLRACMCMRSAVQRVGRAVISRGRNERVVCSCRVWFASHHLNESLGLGRRARTFVRVFLLRVSRETIWADFVKLFVTCHSHLQTTMLCVFIVLVSVASETAR